MCIRDRHQYDCKVALQIFHPEYDVPGVGKMIMQAGMARQAAAKAREEGNEQEAAKQTQLAEQITKDAYAKLHHDMQHFVSEATAAQDVYKRQICIYVAIGQKASTVAKIVNTLKKYCLLYTSRCV